MSILKSSFVKIFSIILMLTIIFSQVSIVNAKAKTVITNKQILIKYKDDSKGEIVKSKIKSKLKLEKIDLKKKMKQSKVEVLEVGANDDVDSVIGELKKDDNVQYAQPNYKLTANDITDEKFAEEWGFQNNGQIAGNQAGTNGIDINVIKAWDVTKGENVVVGVLDTGIDINHADLKDNIYINSTEIAGNGTDDDNNGKTDDVNGWDFVNNDNTIFDSSLSDTHGTEVAGIIAASLNGQGMVGVAPKVKILPLKFMSGNTGYTSDAIDAIEYAKSLGIKIINCSWGGTDYNPALKDAMQNSDILFICAAGNSGKNIDSNPVYPACFGLSNIITVGAVDNQGNLATFSNYGIKVDVAAPGAGILTTIPNNNYSSISGTSASAPFVTGIAALIKSYSNDLTYDQIKSKIINNVTTLDSLAGKVLTSGIVDAFGSLEAKPEDIKPNDTTQTTPVAQPTTTDTTVGTFALPDITQKLIEQIHYGENGVNPATGNYSKTFTDMTSTNLGFTINIGRTYNSKDDRTTSLMGRGWTFNYEGSIKDDSNNPSYKVVKLGDGKAYAFYKNADGTFAANDSRNILVKNYDNTYTMTTKDQMKYNFDINGYLISIVDRNGNAVVIQVDANGKVLKIADAVGNNYTVAYNAQSFISTVTDPIGRVITYNYSNNLLANVLDSTNQYTYYSYDGSNYLTTIKNNSQVTTESITYNHNAGADQDKVTNFINILGDNQAYTYDHTNKKTTITEGNITNVALNGNFVGGTTNWSTTNSNIAIVNNSCEVTENGIYAGLYQNVVLTSGHKYYGSCNIKLENGRSVRFGLQERSGYTWYGMYDISGTGTFQSNSFIGTAGSATPVLFYAYDNASTVGVKYYINNLVLIDLTQVFGAGNEPSQSYMDALIQQYGGYINTNIGLQMIKSYDNYMYITSSQDPEAKVTTVAYNLDASGVNKFGEEKTITDRNGNVYQYARDNNGNITSITNPDGSTKSYTYDEKNNLLSEKDELGKITYYIYDANKINLIKKIQPLNGTDVYVDGADESKFAITSYSYYTDSEILQMGAKGKALLKSITDPEGNITTYTYDANGNIATITDAEGNVTQYTYNQIGWKTQDISPRGYKTDYQYNNNGQLTKTILDQGEVTTYVYDSLGRKTQEVSPNQYNNGSFGDVGTRYTYYSNGKVNTIKDAEGNVTTYYYDLFGNVIKEIKPNNAVYTYQYDVMNRLISVFVNADGRNVQLEGYSYVTTANPTKTYTKYLNDTETAVTIYTYDYADRIISQVNPDGTKLTFSYNANGTLASSTDAKGSVTYYKYDGLNNLTETWTPFEKVNGVTKYIYTKTDYDKASRKIAEKASKITTPLNTYTDETSTNYTYYGTGKVKTVTDKDGRKTVYTYDGDGNTIKEEVYTDSKNTNVTEYEYNDLGKPITKKVYVTSGDLYPNKSDSTKQTMLITKYTYDSNGNVLTITTPDKVTTTFTYDNLNRQLTSSKPGKDENNADTTITKTMSYYYNTDKLSFNVISSSIEDSSKNITTSYSYNQREFLIKVTDALNGVTAYEYDRAGRKVREVSPQNYDYVNNPTDLSTLSRTEYIYDKMDRVKTKSDIYKDSLNNWYTIIRGYKYDLNSNLIKELDPLGYENGGGLTIDDKISSGYGTEYTYNLANKVITILDPQSKLNGFAFTTKYEYDGLGRKASETNAKGAITKYSYDDANNVLKVVVKKNADEPDQVIKTNTYDLANNLLTNTDGNGNTTKYEYNNFNKVKKVMTPKDDTVDSNITTYQYDVMGNVARIQNSLGLVTIYSYDNEGRVLSKTEESTLTPAPLPKMARDAITISYSYDKSGNKRFETDGNGNIKENTFDKLNRLVSTKITTKDIANVSLDHVTNYAYDKNNNVLSQTDLVGSTQVNKVDNTYDALNRLTQKTDAYGKVIQVLEYNINSVQTKSTDASNNVTTYFYDLNNRLIQTNFPEFVQNASTIKKITSQSYDEAGNIATKTDGNGNITSYSYDEFNRLISVANAKGEVTSYTYDLNGNMLTQTDGLGNVTTIEYNAINKPSKKIENGGKIKSDDGTFTYDSSKVEGYTYNPDGSLKTKVDKNGNTINYSYDVHGRMISTLIPSPSPELDRREISITYTYDNNGNQRTITDATGTTVRTYDELNRVKTKTVPNLGTSTYIYDATNTNNASIDAGLIGEISKDPKGNVVIKVYDKVGRLYKVISDGQTSIYSYNDNGSLRTLTYQNGVTENYEYNAANLLTKLTNKKADNSIIGHDYTYTYDAACNMLTKVDDKGTTSYTYDELNRLETVTEPGNKVTSYNYDAAGNRTQEIVNTAGTVQLTDYAYDDQNRLVSSIVTLTNGNRETITYKYDNNGNMIFKTVETAKKANPAIEPTFGIFQAGVTSAGTVPDTTIYEYDELNQLICAKTGNQTITNTYNGEGLRVAKDVNGVLTRYMYEYDKVVLEVDKDGKQVAKNVQGTNLISRTVGNDKLYYLYNGHADVTALIKADGTIAGTYYYDAFGNPDDATKVTLNNTDNEFTYAGYQYDKETGLYYLNSRMYDPVTARFLQEDTYSGNPNDPLSLNLYIYCHNEPMMYNDPNGHFAILNILANALAKETATIVTNAMSGSSSSNKSSSSSGSCSNSSSSSKSSTSVSASSNSIVKNIVQQVSGSVQQYENVASTELSNIINSDTLAINRPKVLDIDYEHLVAMNGLMPYTIAYNNVQHCSYVFYAANTESGDGAHYFVDQAQNVADDFRKKYNSPCYVIEINNASEFQEQWNMMGSNGMKIDGVELIFHGSATKTTGIGYLEMPDDSRIVADNKALRWENGETIDKSVLALNVKEMDYLYFSACNSGSHNIQSIGKAFDNRMKSNETIGWEGGVIYNYNKKQDEPGGYSDNLLKEFYHQPTYYLHEGIFDFQIRRGKVPIRPRIYTPSYVA